MDLPFAVETPLEQRIVDDPAWQEGAAWGEPRPGHPEGAVVAHVADVLDNIERGGHAGRHREQLRVIALVHDAMKHASDGVRRVRGHHGVRARALAERHLDDPDVLDVVEWHDDAYRAWRAKRGGDERARDLLARLGSPERIRLFLDFYRADNATEGKSQEPLRWFEGLAREHGA